MSVSCLVRLALGEKAMLDAPLVDAGGGQPHLPQHYMTYHHNLESVSLILSKIDFAEDVLLFAANDHQGLYLQVGVIGHENYKKPNISYPHKIVYGRKWRIDSDTPSSEIIQTAMLAIKKVMEHEVREFLTLTVPNHSTFSAPLSSHQDVGMLQKAASHKLGMINKTTPKADSKETLAQYLKTIRFANYRLTIENYTALNKDRAFVDLALTRDEVMLVHGKLPPAFHEQTISIVVNLSEIDGVLYTLLDALIAVSDRYVEENFTFEDFQRFSRKISPTWLAQQSLASRPYALHMKDEQFKRTFETLNFATDQQRKPELGSGLLAEINTKKLLRYENLSGHLPNGYTNNTLKLKHA